MSSLDKKSSIPRPAHECDRQGKSKPKGPKPPFVQKPPQHSKPPVSDGLIHENANALRHSLNNLEVDHDRMKQTLEDTVREAEERLEVMRKLMEEREKRMAGTLETQSQQIEQLEQTVDNCEKKLLENNIDPVTGETLEPAAEETEQVEKIRKVTKADVSRMREQLLDLNQKSDQYLVDVQHMLQELRELEATSSRVGDLQAIDMTPEEIAAFIAEEEEKEKEKERRSKQKEDSSEADSPSASPQPEDRTESRAESSLEFQQRTGEIGRAHV